MTGISRVLVIDASVILKIAFRSAPGEQDTVKAEALLQGWLDGNYEIILPKLWTFEIGNVLGMKNPRLASEIMELLLDYRFSEVEISPDICRQTFDIMEKCKTTFYDAVYHAIAILNAGVFVTADSEYYKKTRRIGKIMLLKDFPL